MIHSEERIIPVRLKDQVVVVTGVSHPGQGGYGLAAAFAKEGALLAMSARNAHRFLDNHPSSCYTYSRYLMNVK
jgi:enoyl-[acyl-carrier-protein] reductase (NADH)